MNAARRGAGRIWFALFTAALVLAGCASDSERALAQNRAERERGLATMRQATRDAARGSALEGEALEAQLREHTHLFEFGEYPNGKRGAYRLYYTFMPGGRLLYRDNWIYGRDTESADTWRVDGARLCLRAAASGPEPRCYTLARRPDGQIQYYIAQPGAPGDGLLTLVTSKIFAATAAPPDPASR